MTDAIWLSILIVAAIISAAIGAWLVDRNWDQYESEEGGQQ